MSTLKSSRNVKKKLFSSKAQFLLFQRHSFRVLLSFCALNQECLSLGVAQPVATLCECSEFDPSPAVNLTVVGVCEALCRLQNEAASLL